MFTKCVFEQFMMPPKKKLKADRHIADVEKGFGVQNLICTGPRIRPTTENQEMLLRVQMEAPTDKGGEGSVRLRVDDEGNRSVGAKRQRMLSDEREESRHSWW